MISKFLFILVISGCQSIEENKYKIRTLEGNVVCNDCADIRKTEQSKCTKCTCCADSVDLCCCLHVDHCTCNPSVCKRK